MLRGRLDRERGQRERHGERDVVALGARGRGPTVRGMRLVHPHRRLRRKPLARPWLPDDACPLPRCTIRRMEMLLAVDCILNADVRL